MWYNRQGESIDHQEWSRLQFENYDYRIVKQEMIGNLQVSTVLVGIDMSWDKRPPMIFETMIFCKDENIKDHELDGWQDRYATEEQAIKGHEVVVEMAKKWLEEHAHADSAIRSLRTL